jgi:hypothetical protein
LYFFLLVEVCGIHALQHRTTWCVVVVVVVCVVVVVVGVVCVDG